MQNPITHHGVSQPSFLKMTPLHTITVHPMPVLHRWDSDSDDGAKPAGLWRYDETSDGGSGEASSSGESSPFGKDFRN